MNVLSPGVPILMTWGFSLAPANVNGIILINCRRDEEENVVQNHYLLTMFRFTAAINMRPELTELRRYERTVPFVPEKETAIVQQSQAIVRVGICRMPVPKCEYSMYLEVFHSYALHL